MRRSGIPELLRFPRSRIPIARDKNTGKEVDNLALGKSLGVEVAEVGDAREAFQFLTGTNLPGEAAPLTEDAKLPGLAQKRFRELAEGWRERYRHADKTLRGASSRDLNPDVKSFWILARKNLAQGEEDLERSHVSAAYNRMWLAAINAEFAESAVNGTRAFYRAGFPGLHTYGGGEVGEIQKRTRSTIESLKDTSPKTLIDAPNFMAIGNQLTGAMAYLREAERLLAASQERLASQPRDVEEIALLAFQALAHLSLAEGLIDVAPETAGWLGQECTALPDGIFGDFLFASLVDLYTSTARLNLEYVDTLETRQVSRQEKLDLKTAQEWMRRYDVYYAAGRGSLEEIYKVSDKFTDPNAAQLIELGGLLNSATLSALLVAQYYSLDAIRDDTGKVVGYGRKEALEHMTNVAEREALRAIAEAHEATKGESTAALFAFIPPARQPASTAITPPLRRTG